MPKGFIDTLKTQGLTLTWCVAMTIGALVFAWNAAADHTRLTDRVSAQEAKSGDHETRLRTEESQLQTIAADVSWIRKHIERQQKTTP